MYIINLVNYKYKSIVVNGDSIKETKRNKSHEYNYRDLKVVSEDITISDNEIGSVTTSGKRFVDKHNNHVIDLCSSWSNYELLLSYSKKKGLI